MDTAATQPVPEKTRLPIPVRIIASLYTIAGVFGFLGVIGMAYAMHAFGKYVGLLQFFGTLGLVILLVLSFIFFIVGRGLFRRHTWARKMTVILSIVSIVGIFFGPEKSMGSMVFQLVLNILIIAYMLFSRQVRAAFAKGQK